MRWILRRLTHRHSEAYCHFDDRTHQNCCGHWGFECVLAEEKFVAGWQAILEDGANFTWIGC